MGAIDGGFTGWAVCGTRRLQTLRDAGATLSPLPASGDLYVFGGGTARAVGTYDWTVKCGDVCRTGRLEAVKGSLCLLLGRQFGADFGLSDDMANDEIRQEEKVLPTIDIEGLKHIQVNCTRGAKSSSVRGGKSSQSVEKRSQEQPYEKADQQLAAELQADEVRKFEELRSEELRAEKRAHARNSKSAQAAEKSEEWQWPKKTWKVKDDGPMFRGLKSLQVKTSSRIEKLVGAERKKEEKEVEVAGKEVEVAESETVSLPVGPSGRRRPKFFDFSDKKLTKMHRKGHGGVERLMDLFRGALSRKERKEWKGELEGLEKRVQAVCNDCKGCDLAERPQKPGTSLRPLEREAFGRIVTDLISLDARKNFHAIGLIDEATAEIALQVVENKTPEAAAEGAFVRWFSLRGSPNVIVSDLGREFLGGFIDCLGDLGVEVAKTAAQTPQAHAKVERAFETVRRSLDRVVASGKRPQTKREWQGTLSTIENSMRNELRQGGFSSAQRGTGRGCLLERNLMTDTPVTGYAQEEVCRLLELSREASDAYRAAVHGRKIRQAVNEKIGPELRKYEQGEKVYYFRDEARGIRWRGPAVVVGYNPDMKTYVVSSGGRIIHVGWRHLKSAEERGEEEPSVGAKAEAVAKAEERADEQQAAG